MKNTSLRYKPASAKRGNSTTWIDYETIEEAEAALYKLRKDAEDDARKYGHNFKKSDFIIISISTETETDENGFFLGRTVTEKVVKTIKFI